MEKKEIGYRSSRRKRLILLDRRSHDRLRRRFHLYYDFGTSKVNFVRLEIASTAVKQHECGTCYSEALLEFTAYNRKANEFFRFFCCNRCYWLFFGEAMTAEGHRRVAAAVKKHHHGQEVSLRPEQHLPFLQEVVE
ncbi:MAG: hypothetical protein ACFFD4_02385 [Candidatus Odinarchaeota archaeon]